MSKKTIDLLREKVTTLIPWYFGISAGLAGAVLISGEFSSTIETFLEKHTWIFFLALAPLASYVIIAGILMIVAAISFSISKLFKKYYELRQSGYGHGEALRIVAVLFVIILILFILAFYSGGSRYSAP